ncbi:MAG: hypothetical protein ACK5NK_04105 [Niabella sp.]
MLIQLPPVQNWIIGKVTAKLSRDLQTKIEIDRVDFSLFNKMHLKGVLLEDRQKDTILSAGELTVNITDWFFLKKNIELKYIGLKDAYINLQRTDSVWRYQFLLDYFSSPGSKKSNSKSNISLAIKNVDLQNIRLQQKDAWVGQDMNVSLTSLTTNPRNIDFNNRIIDIRALTINKPYVALRVYSGLKPPNMTPVPKPVVEKDSAALSLNVGNWNIKAEQLSIRNGTFRNDNDQREKLAEGFDANHIAFEEIYADFKNLLWQKDTITANMSLTTKEQSGFTVKQFLANAKVTPQEIAFNNLDILTNQSHLTDYFSMRFAGFSDMSDFIDKVNLHGVFQNASINSDDIAFFAPALKTWKKTITVTGNIQGPVSAIHGSGLKIQAGSNTSFEGTASLTGLPDINTTFIDVTAQPLKTTYADALAIAPALKTITTPDLKQLKYVNFSGNFTGFIRDFVTSGSIQTALGNLKTDVNMKLPQKGNPVYSGSVATDNFNLGLLLGQPDLGFVSTNTNLKGAGFDPEKGNINLDTKIRYIDFNGYRYQNIQADGEVNRNIFDGNIKIDDPNVRLTMNGLVNYNQEVPKFDFLADIQTLNFKNLNLTKDSLSLTGKINVNFTGKNIDDFLGNAAIKEATLINNGTPLSFDSLSLVSNIIDGQKHLNIRSTQFSADVTGTYNIMELPASFTLFLSRYYPSYIKPPKSAPQNQAFSFNVKTDLVNEYFRLIDSTLQGFNNSQIEGSINTVTNDLTLNVNVPWFKFQQYSFSDASIIANGHDDKLTVTGKTANVNVGENMQIPFINFDIAAQNDVSDVKIFSGQNQANLDAIIKTYSDGVNITFQPSSFLLNGKTWQIEERGELEFRANTPAHGQLRLTETSQEILIKTQPSDVGSWNDIAVGIKNLNLGDIAPYILPNNRLEGLVTSNVMIENPGKNMRITSNDFTGNAIRFDNDSLGDIKAKLVYNFPTQELLVNGKTQNPENRDLAFDIHLYLKDEESQQKNVIALDANSFDLKYLNRFLGFLFSDISGAITGKFEVKGPFDGIYVVGKGRLHNAGLKVNFTQCFYKIEDREIELTENEINLNGIVLEDTVTKNPVYLTGGILHNAFEDMFFDITVSTRKPDTRDPNNNRPVQVLKTTYNDNHLFYGNVKATGSFVLLGSADNSYMKIDAIASEKDESTFTIASDDSRAGAMPDWLVERKFGTQQADSVARSKTAANMTYELNVTANPKVLMKFVMDDLTGDEIKGRGSGSLNIKAGTNDPLTIKGRFDIEEGSYNYTFQSVFKKPFEIIKGTENYISWNGIPGDALNANINFNARYVADRVSFSPLAAASDIDDSYSNTRERVFVTAKLMGKLFQPDFQFGIELDPNSRYNNDFNVSNVLAQIQRRPEEVVRQVTYLIVLNSFAPPETGVASAAGEFGNAVNELGYNTISSLSGIFFNEINKKLNNELAKLLGSKVSVVFSGSVYNRNILTSNNGFDINQASFSGALRAPLFNDRFVISLGSSMEVPLQQSLEQTVQFLPDVTAEWLINNSGTIRLNLFYRENLDYLTGSSTGAAKLKRTGAGISFKKEFDRLGELFANKRKRTLRDIESTKPLADTLNRVETVTPQKSDPLSPTVTPNIP